MSLDFLAQFDKPVILFNDKKDRPYFDLLKGHGISKSRLLDAIESMKNTIEAFAPDDKIYFIKLNVEGIPTDETKG